MVEVYGNKCAIIHGNVHVTYDALQASSNQLARLLIKQGVEPDTLVALMLPHSKKL